MSMQSFFFYSFFYLLHWVQEQRFCMKLSIFHIDFFFFCIDVTGNILCVLMEHAQALVLFHHEGVSLQLQLMRSLIIYSD